MLKHHADNVLTSQAAPAAFGRLCVETKIRTPRLAGCQNQPPSGGCVLKLEDMLGTAEGYDQPPSGGCVLKRCHVPLFLGDGGPAAFGRLCVETLFNIRIPLPHNSQPPSGGCVLKQADSSFLRPLPTSRLRAAVC